MKKFFSIYFIVKLTDALVLANDFIFIEGTKTERFPDGLYVLHLPLML